MIRQATLNDVAKMEELMYSSFGNREDATSFRLHTDKYLVYEVDDKIVAMTGILYSNEYKALEIGWTCTHPDYRQLGIMHKLFEEILKEVKENVYCSCWHLSDREHINLYKLMRDFNFICVARPRVSWVNGHNCHHNMTDNLCTYCTGDGCHCTEELYFREYIREGD